MDWWKIFEETLIGILTYVGTAVVSLIGTLIFAPKKWKEWGNSKQNKILTTFNIRKSISSKIKNINNGDQNAPNITNTGDNVNISYVNNPLSFDDAIMLDNDVNDLVNYVNGWLDFDIEAKYRSAHYTFKRNTINGGSMFCAVYKLIVGKIEQKAKDNDYYSILDGIARLEKAIKSNDEAKVRKEVHYLDKFILETAFKNDGSNTDTQ